MRKLLLLIALASASASTVTLAETNLNLDELVVTGTRSETSLIDLAGNTGKVHQEDIVIMRWA